MVYPCCCGSKCPEYAIFKTSTQVTNVKNRTCDFMPLMHTSSHDFPDACIHGRAHVFSHRRPHPGGAGYAGGERLQQTSYGCPHGLSHGCPYSLACGRSAERGRHRERLYTRALHQAGRDPLQLQQQQQQQQQQGEAVVPTAVRRSG